MATTIYGVSRSRAIRSLWAIEETGIEYTHVPTHFFKESKTDEYLGVNPNGRIPALVDGDVTLFESMAINLYLARKYAPELYPSDPVLEAQVNQWSVWGISEIEFLQMQVIIQIMLHKDNMNQRAMDEAMEALPRPLKVLDEHLKDRDYLLGDSFTIADLNVSAVMLLLEMIKFDLTDFENVSDWQARCYARAALTRAQALD